MHATYGGLQNRYWLLYAEATTLANGAESEGNALAKKNKIRVTKVVREENLFIGDLSLREIARRTGLDVGYLSRVKNGEIAIGEENLRKIWKAVAR